MANFPKAVELLHRKAPKVAVIYGEPVLREFFVDEFRKVTAKSDLNSSTIYASEVPEAEVWEALTEFPLGETDSKCLVVRGAERLDIDKLLVWLQGSIPPFFHAALVFEWAEWPRERGRKKSQHEEARAVFSKSTKVALVDCTLPRNEESSTNVLTESLALKFSNLSPTDLAACVEWAAGDSLAAVSVARHASVLKSVKPVPITSGVLAQLVPRSWSDNFVNAMIQLDRRAAMEASKKVTNPSAVISQLISELLDVEAVHRAKSTNAGKYEKRRGTVAIAESLKMHRTKVIHLWNVSKYYDSATSAKRWRALYFADTELQSGSRDDRGILQTLVHLWF